jgi:hypothetical protein
MKLSHIKLHQSDVLWESLFRDGTILTENVFSMLDDLSSRLNAHGSQDVEAIKLISGLLLYVRTHQGSGGVVGLNALLNDTDKSDQAVNSLTSVSKQHPEEFAKCVNEIRVAIKQKTVYSVVTFIRGFFERRNRNDNKK